MSIRAIVWAFEAECPSPSAKLLLVLLANDAAEDGECRPFRAGLAKQCCLSSIHKEIDDLVASGLLKVHQGRYFLAYKPPIVLSFHRARVLRKTGGRCFYCDIELNQLSFHIDHKVPRALGGTDSFANLVPACPSCNVSKGVLSAETFIGRLRRRSE